LLLLINCYLISGRVAKARPLIERLLVLDPLTPLSQCLRAFADAMEGNFSPAIEAYRRMLEMDPGNPMARLFYVWILVVEGRNDIIATVLEGAPHELNATIPARLTRFLALAAAGNAAGAHACLTTGTDISDVLARAADVLPRLVAQGYALAGMPDRALHWLTVAVDRGFINYPFLAHHDPCFATLRASPAYQALMEVVRERWAAFDG
jgi:tetratricopeptide (TPR) repeat protein